MKPRRPWGYWKQEAAKLEVGKPIPVKDRIEYFALRYAAKSIGIRIVMRDRKIYRIE